MGQNFDKTEFLKADYLAFNQKLHKQLDELRELLELGLVNEGSTSIGAELEMYIVDHNLLPAPLNQTLLSDLNNPLLQEEINQYNLEFNLAPVDTEGTPFSGMEQQLNTTLSQIQKAASQYQAQVVPIGILPTLSQQHLKNDYMTPLPRYQVLDRELAKLKGSDFNININGLDSIQTSCKQVTLEGANTSFQLHLKVPSNEFKNWFNAAQLITPLVTAIAANSPIFLGKCLWHETRVALFKQSIDCRSDDEFMWRKPARVNFGQGWVRDNAWELFAENVSIFPPIIPLLGEQSFAELNLHHGTVWNWNRAVFQPGEDAHLRIEYRSLPAGPTVKDMMANSALAIGLTSYMQKHINQYIARLPFKYAEYNFYRAAQFGINSKLIWPQLNQIELQEHNTTEILTSLLPNAIQGLVNLGIEQQEADELISIIKQRLEKNQNGATWQLQKYQQLKQTLDEKTALNTMLDMYIKNVQKGKPVATWP